MSKHSRRASKILSILGEGSRSLKLDPSSANRRQWERRLERAAKSNNDWIWVCGAVVLGLLVFLAILVFPASYFGRSDTRSTDTTDTSKTFSATPYTLSSRRVDTECPGAPSQRVDIGSIAVVCTDYDRLIIRQGPGQSNSEITRIYPGTNLVILDGPVCSGVYSWWKIRTESGTTGWVAEGGDSIDPYYICPTR